VAGCRTSAQPNASIGSRTEIAPWSSHERRRGLHCRLVKLGLLLNRQFVEGLSACATCWWGVSRAA